MTNLQIHSKQFLSCQNSSRLKKSSVKLSRNVFPGSNFVEVFILGQTKPVTWFEWVKNYQAWLDTVETYQILAKSFETQIVDLGPVSGIFSKGDFFFIEIFPNFSEAITSWKSCRVFPLMGFLEDILLLIDTLLLLFCFSKKISKFLKVFETFLCTFDQINFSKMSVEAVEKVEIYQILDEKIETSLSWVELGLTLF